MISLLPTFFYAVDNKGVFVNQYIPSEYVSDGMNFRIETEYPQTEQIRLEILSGVKKTGKLHLRIPGWCKDAQVSLNGVKQKHVRSGEYFSLSRKWKAGDVIELLFPMELKWQRRAHYADYSYTRTLGGEPMYSEVATTNIPYALRRGPVV